MNGFKTAREYLDYVDSHFIKEDGYLDIETKANWIKSQLEDIKLK